MRKRPSARPIEEKMSAMSRALGCMGSPFSFRSRQARDAWKVVSPKSQHGATWEQAKTIIVENVDQFPGHIACSSESKSEIVLPAFKNGEVYLILDVDSTSLADFDAIDEQFLEEVMRLIEGKI